MYGMNHKRLHSRFAIEKPILFSKWDSEDMAEGTMRNVSEAGMYFESDQEMEFASQVFIWMGDARKRGPSHPAIYDFYRSRVRWSKPLETGEGMGVGVRHIIRTRGVSGPEFQCGMCEKKVRVSKVFFVNDFLYLCPLCHTELEHCTGAGRDEILRILEGNVF